MWSVVINVYSHAELTITKMLYYAESLPVVKSYYEIKETPDVMEGR